MEATMAEAAAVATRKQRELELKIMQVEAAKVAAVAETARVQQKKEEMEAAMAEAAAMATRNQHMMEFKMMHLKTTPAPAPAPTPAPPKPLVIWESLTHDQQKLIRYRYALRYCVACSSRSN